MSEHNRRYAAQMALPFVSEARQQKLANSRVLCVGAGGLAAGALPYLISSGVGNIRLVDADTIDVSNLARQIFFTEADVGKCKVDILKNRLSAVHPSCQIETHAIAFTENTANILLRDVDILIDATDNALARYLISDATSKHRIPHVYASALRYEGHCAVFDARYGPCYRCLFPQSIQADEACTQAGVWSPLPGLMGLLQATETLKYLMGIGKTWMGQLLLYDALTGNIQTVAIAQDPNCLCHMPSTFRDNAMISTTALTPPIITAAELDDYLAREEVLLVDVREPSEYATGHLTGSWNFPMSVFDPNHPKLNSAKNIVVYCHAGIRSAHAARWLLAQGFQHVRHLLGGLMTIMR